MTTSATLDSITLDVRGMWCTSCANAVERVLKRQPGVLDATVSFAAESAQLQWDPHAATLAQIVAAVEKIGYPCVAEGDGHDRRAHFARIKRDLGLRLVVAVFFDMWVMAAQWPLYLFADSALSRPAQYALSLFAGLMCLPVVAWCALPFLRAGWRTLRAGAPGMDVLVSLGALGAFALSVWRLTQGDPAVYFDSAATIVTFLLAGRLIEMSVRARSADAVRTLLDLPPEQVGVVNADGSEVATLVKRVAPGSVVRIRPGERIALDGFVTHGTSRIDRSLLTGETQPASVRCGDAVEAGTLNGDGELIVRVQAAWGARRVDRIAGEVRRMLARKTASQTLAERFTRHLATVVCVLALVACALGRYRGMTWPVALEHAVAVLVITCPCALGMAVPLALSAGVGRAAREGILFRDVEALEKAGRISQVYLDKTGTLTEGRPTLVDLRLAPGVARDDLIETAALAERGSEHALAKSIRSLVPAARLDALDRATGVCRAVPGAGVEWRGEDGVCLRVGQAAWLAGNGVAVPSGPAQHTLAHVARADRWLGALAFADAPRPGAREAVRRLRASGLAVAILSGDADPVARDIAHQVGIAQTGVFSGQSPEDKARRVQAAQASLACVMFVGDGLNDAPALAAADLGVAVEGATASSVASAAIVLMGGDIARLDHALASARLTARTMKQNLAAAAVYNLMAIPLALTGHVSPAMAAALMVASSLSVTFNSARLLWAGNSRDVAALKADGLSHVCA
ncbi:copper/silver-translocating P-type ATPase [Paraburkholderia unamae]|uniref:heavy metal translocating P-type ATPase n=1 Tax=Paraburkholderia unamae TaxID=219649 RepID=UPI000DC2AFF3|nr:cation-translocating P-type ATPase [Paraburkholderia unamae]RAR50757.1 copper/silver-translocating P-type ATPase [Paraburkholderia unamae]